MVTDEKYHRLAHHMPQWLGVRATRWLLRVLGVVIGPENPIQDAALARLKRSSRPAS